MVPTTVPTYLEGAKAVKGPTAGKWYRKEALPGQLHLPSSLFTVLLSEDFPRAPCSHYYLS